MDLEIVEHNEEEMDAVRIAERDEARCEEPQKERNK